MDHENNRNHARPKLETVNLALNELLELALSCIDTDLSPTSMEDTQAYLNDKWEVILNKYDINYSDLKRWDET